MAAPLPSTAHGARRDLIGPSRCLNPGRAISRARHAWLEEQAGLQAIPDAVSTINQDGCDLTWEVGASRFLEQAEPAGEVGRLELFEREMLAERIALVAACLEQDRGPKCLNSRHMLSPTVVGDCSREDRAEQRIAAHACVEGVEKADEATSSRMASGMIMRCREVLVASRGDRMRVAFSPEREGRARAADRQLVSVFGVKGVRLQWPRRARRARSWISAF